MSTFNFSQKTIAALVMGLGVSFYAPAGVGKLRLISVDTQQFKAEIPIVDEPIPDSAAIRLADQSKYGLAPYTSGASKLHFSRDGNRILVDGPMPSQGDPLRFALEISWPQGVIVREFRVDPVLNTLAVESEKNNISVNKKKETEDTSSKSNESQELNAVKSDLAGLDTLKLGDLKVVSALGQKLSVEVDIYGSALQKTSKIDVQVFPDVGLAGDNPELLQTLSNLEYKVVKRPSGRHILRLRSKKVINEPILPLQIEAVAGNERSVRQYTVLLDPAGYQQAKKGNGFDYASASQKSTKGVISQKVQSRRRSSSGSYVAGNDSSLRPLKVYKVLKGDSLSEIARKMGGKEGLAEKMQQLKDANPNAFIRGDINLLRAGATLHYPANWQLAASHDVLNDTSSKPIRQNKVAKSAVVTNTKGVSKAQTGENVKTTKPKATIVEKKVTDQKVSAEKAATEKAAVAAKAAAEKAAAEKAAAEKAAAEKAAAEKAAVAAKAAAEKAAAEKAAAEKAAVAAKAAAEKAATEKAAVAKTVTTESSSALASVASVPQNEKAEVTKAVTTEGSSPLASVASVPQNDVAITEAALMARLAEQDQELEQSMRETSELQAQIAVLSEQASNDVAAKVVEHEQPVQEESNLFVLVDDYKVIGVVIGLIAIAAWGGVWVRRRRKANQNDFESLEGMSGEVSGLALTSLMSSSEPGAAELDMTDPLEEAEVCVEGGEVNKALDLLREGLTREPMRQDVRLRLLELLAQKNEQHAFIEEALVAKTLFGDDSPLWQRLVEFAQMMNPVPEQFVKTSTFSVSDSVNGLDSDSSSPARA